MPVHNVDIANYFREMADLLDIQGADQYRVRAYRNAANNIQDLNYNLRDIADQPEKLQEIPGIGKDLSAKIQYIVKNKKLPELEELKEELPEGLLDLLNIEGLGPKRVKKLFQELNIHNQQDLKLAAENQEIQQLGGLGEKIEENILERLESGDAQDKRFLRVTASQIIEPLLEYLEESGAVEKLTVAGSYRRKKETVGDIDLLLVAKDREKVRKLFIDYEDVERVLNKGEKKISVVLKNNFQVDLRIVEAESFGAALLYFTGSKDHNIVLRQLALDQDYKLNEYALFKGEEKIAGKTEKEIYQKLGLKWIPPELRQAKGEIEAAKNDELPNLLEMSQIKGDLQMHTTASDGKNSLKEMVEAATELGYEYIAISDHSQNLQVADGLDKKRFKKQFEEIEELNQTQDQIKVLKAIEVDILKDGSLDFAEDFLKNFDLVLCAIHSHFNLSREEQTERVIKAMQSSQFHIFAHPTGRLINSREGYEIDLKRVLKEAKKRNVIVEINAQPSRLDLDDANIRTAKEIGVQMSLGTDAHSTNELKYMQFGVDQARRGWATATDIVNTKNWSHLKELLNK